MELKYLNYLLHLLMSQLLDKLLQLQENIFYLHLIQSYVQNLHHFHHLIKIFQILAIHLLLPLNIFIFLPYFLIRAQYNYQTHHKDSLLPFINSNNKFYYMINNFSISIIILRLNIRYFENSYLLLIRNFY